MWRKNRDVPNQPKTPTRAVRVPDELWRAAMEVARSRGESLSAVIRDLLVEYVRRYGKWPPE